MTMVAYSFKRQFVEPIRIGLGLPPLVLPPARPKRQTIRANRKRHARPGEELQFYCCMRTKGCFLIGRAKCTEVSGVRLQFGRNIVSVDDYPAIRDDDGALDVFAQADGFEHWMAMRDFWKENHGGSVFTGVIIYWQPIEETPR